MKTRSFALPQEPIWVPAMIFELVEKGKIKPAGLVLWTLLKGLRKPGTNVVEGPTMKDISELLHISMPTMQANLEDLVRNGLIEIKRVGTKGNSYYFLREE
jgi:DNA-binding MarR family transcriptional regulator